MPPRLDGRQLALRAGLQLGLGDLGIARQRGLHRGVVVDAVGVDRAGHQLGEGLPDGGGVGEVHGRASIAAVTEP